MKTILKVLVEAKQKKWIEKNAKKNKTSEAEWVRQVLEKRMADGDDAEKSYGK